MAASMSKFSLGEWLGLARELKGWTLRDLEKRTGISNALISQIETGHVKEPGFRNVVRLARALGLDLARLADEVDRRGLKRPALLSSQHNKGE